MVKQLITWLDLLLIKEETAMVWLAVSATSMVNRKQQPVNLFTVLLTKAPLLCISERPMGVQLWQMIWRCVG